MSATFVCPRCSASMKVAEGLAAHYAFCPKCEGRVWVTASRDNAESEPSEPESPSSDAPQAHAPKPLAPASEPETQVPDPLPPPKQAASGAKWTDPPKEPTAPPLVSQPVAPPQTAAEPVGGVGLPITPTVAVVPQPSPTAPRRVAKFITADVAQSRLELENDGELPQLQLTEFGGKKQKKELSQSGNQWRIVLIVCGSLAVSVLLLMLGPSEPGRSRNQPADNARAILGHLYIGTEKDDLKTYQIYLREALVAHSHGDFSTERRYYRRVLHLLSAENIDPDNGLTGLRHQSSDGRLPSDTQLHRLLSTLLNSQ